MAEHQVAETSASIPPAAQPNSITPPPTIKQEREEQVWEVEEAKPSAPAPSLTTQSPPQARSQRATRSHAPPPANTIHRAPKFKSKANRPYPASKLAFHRLATSGFLRKGDQLRVPLAAYIRPDGWKIALTDVCAVMQVRAPYLTLTIPHTDFLLTLTLDH